MLPTATPSTSEGILPAIESSHALAGTIRLAKKLVAEGAVPEETIIIVNLSGRGDKDVGTAAAWFDMIEPGAADAEITGTDAQKAQEK